MVCTGKVQNGVILLENGTLPEGTKVQIEPIKVEHDPSLTLWDKVIGQAEGLPPDLALNHDHYLHGQSKK